MDWCIALMLPHGQTERVQNYLSPTKTVLRWAAFGHWGGASALHAAGELSRGLAGHLWQGRFASFVMDEPQLLAAARYVELNPVRAQLVVASEYR